MEQRHWVERDHVRAVARRVEVEGAGSGDYGPLLLVGGVPPFLVLVDVGVEYAVDVHVAPVSRGVQGPLQVEMGIGGGRCVVEGESGEVVVLPLYRALPGRRVAAGPVGPPLEHVLPAVLKVGEVPDHVVGPVGQVVV